MQHRRPNTVIPYSRDYRRPPRWNMGLPPRKPPRRGPLRRLADPRRYLKAVIVLGLAALAALPPAGDAVNAALTPAAPDACRVLTVIDGDTVTLWCPAGGAERARLRGFDAPELFSPGCASEWLAATRATFALRAMLWRAQEVSVVRRGSDRYGRALADLFLDGAPAARRMIAAGHARAYDGGRRGGWCGRA